VNEALTISYEQALTGAANVVQLSYQLSRRLSLIARAGTENALDLVYTIAFD
jgi:translocation and assembly module TamB